MNKQELPELGWREWVGFPDQGVDWVKAKVDTGARTSSLHADDLEAYVQDGAERVRFTVYPWQRSTDGAVAFDVPVLDWRKIRPSSGEEELRPVVHLPARIAGRVITVEFTLTSRDAMGFRLLLGRQALRKRFLVNPGRSYRGGRPPASIRRANRARPPAEENNHD